MNLTSMKKVTIVAEEVLEKRLSGELRDLGVRGYTIADVRGEGAHGARPSEWTGHNVQFDLVVSEALALRILEHLDTTYFGARAVVAWLTTVEVNRPSLFL